MESTFEPTLSKLDYCDLCWLSAPLFPKPGARQRYILGSYGAAILVGPPGAALEDDDNLYGFRRIFERGEAILAAPLPPESEQHRYSEAALGTDWSEVGRLFAAEGWFVQADPDAHHLRGFCGLSAEARGRSLYHDQRTLEEQFPVLSVLMVLRAFPQCCGVLTLAAYPEGTSGRPGRFMMRLDVTGGPGEGYQALIAPKSDRGKLTPSVE